MTWYLNFNGPRPNSNLGKQPCQVALYGVSSSPKSCLGMLLHQSVGMRYCTVFRGCGSPSKEYHTMHLKWIAELASWLVVGRSWKFGGFTMRMRGALHGVVVTVKWSITTASTWPWQRNSHSEGYLAQVWYRVHAMVANVQMNLSWNIRNFTGITVGFFFVCVCVLDYSNCFKTKRIGYLLKVVNIRFILLKYHKEVSNLILEKNTMATVFEVYVMR